MKSDFADAQRRAAMARKLAAKATGAYYTALEDYADDAEAGRPPDRTWQLTHLGHLVGRVRT